MGKRSGEKKVLEGEKVEVKCTASRYNYSEDSISWYKQTVHGNQEIASVEDRSLEMYTDITRFDIVKGLKFKAIQTDNSGTYVCRARPPGPRRRHNLDAVLREDQIEIRVQAYEPPRLYSTNMYSNETLIFGKGEGVRLFCKVGGTHMPKVSWYKDGKPVTLNDNLKLVEKTQALIVGVVVEDIDEGEYRCEAENDKGKLTRTQRVVKVEPPSIHQTNLLGEMEAGKSRAEGNQAKLVDAGGSMLLQCRVLGRPRPTIIWRRNGAELDPARANITDGNQTLLLRNLRVEDAGKYECFVKNQGGTTAVFQNVEVQESSIMATIYATGIAIPVFIAWTMEGSTHSTYTTPYPVRYA
ncbi:hemicentin-2 [Eurytemora carolleeae]|uniref:hemicentin-2 n=1 Tax=Eurytemora carolleeae TaxID=1294199 RepID=UPI000C774337|nr:hemicentin-2 [Eurytemora carolleeae]|eukprot:XP_023347787.1 hemicentin-2-like [Eurytemora affinis]